MGVAKLRAFIDTELYETETLKMDVADYGNIANNVSNKDCVQSILRFIKDINVQSATFSVGMRFYFWQYYEHLDELPAVEQIVLLSDNKHDHGGYKVSDLFIKAK